jgi:hypothetical protein
MPAIEGDGWFVDTSTGQIGPISSAALERLVSTGEVRLATLVWHESLEDWTTLQSVLSIDASWDLEVARRTAKLDPMGDRSKTLRAPAPQPICGPASTVFSSRRVKVTNSLHLLSVLIAAFVTLLILVALIKSGEAGVLAALLMLAFMYLVFWTGIEFSGTTVDAGVLTYPVRLKYWPHILPVGRRAIPVERIKIVSATSLGLHTHFLQITTDGSERNLLFEDVFMREVFLLAIMARTTPIGTAEA